MAMAPLSKAVTPSAVNGASCPSTLARKLPTTPSAQEVYVAMICDTVCVTSSWLYDLSVDRKVPRAFILVRYRKKLLESGFQSPSRITSS